MSRTPPPPRGVDRSPEAPPRPSPQRRPRHAASRRARRRAAATATAPPSDSAPSPTPATAPPDHDTGAGSGSGSGSGIDAATGDAVIDPAAGDGASGGDGGSAGGSGDGSGDAGRGDGAGGSEGRSDAGAQDPRPWWSPSVGPDQRRRAAAVGAGAAGSLALAGVLAVSGAGRPLVLAPIVAVGTAALVWSALYRFEWFVVAVLVVRASLDAAKVGTGGGGLDPSLVVGYLVVVAALLWMARPREGAWVRPAAPTWAALVLLAASLSSTATAADRTASVLDVARVAAAVSLLVVLDRFVDSRRAVRLVLVAVFASALVPLAVAAVQAASGRGGIVADGFSRVRGTFVHPNPLALYLSLLLVMAVALVRAAHRVQRVALYAFVGVAGAVLLATYARGAWMAAAAGLVAVALVQRRWWLLGALAGAAMVALLAVPSVGGRFADIGRADRASGEASNSVSWRVQYWGRSLDLLPESPVVGIGLGMVSARLPEGVHPHNDYVRALVETGVVGLVAFVGLLATLAAAAARAVRRARAPDERAVAAGFAGVVVTLAVLCLSANVLTQVAVLWYAFALCAVGLWVARRPPGAPAPPPEPGGAAT